MRIMKYKSIIKIGGKIERENLGSLVRAIRSQLAMFSTPCVPEDKWTNDPKWAISHHTDKRTGHVIVVSELTQDKFEFIIAKAMFFDLPYDIWWTAGNGENAKIFYWRRGMGSQRSVHAHDEIPFAPMMPLDELYECEYYRDLALVTTL